MEKLGEVVTAVGLEAVKVMEEAMAAVANAEEMEEAAAAPVDGEEAAAAAVVAARGAHCCLNRVCFVQQGSLSICIVRYR